MNDIEKRLAALPPEKRKLFLQQLNHELSTQRSDLQRILPQSRETNTFPLSFSQKRLWFLDQLEPGNVAYNIPIAIRLKGNLNLQALEKSLSEIARRHESLRTTFVTVMDEPLQVINPPEPNVLMAIDLQSISDTEREAEVQQLISEEALRSFDLARGPLLRTTLLKLGKEDHVLLITMHHIVSDGWSIGLFVRELGAHYQFFCGEQSAPLPELPVQYADFSKWQQEWLQGEILETQLGYWKTQLKHPLPTLDLSIDYSRPKIQTFNGAKQMLELSQSLTEALKELSRQEGCTLFMTMLAAFNVLLYRQTGQPDIIIGSPIAGRNRAELENLIGFFLNTLALRVNLDGNPSFRELLKNVREVALAAYANQDIPFEKLLEEIHPERDLSRTPIFQVFFNMLNLNEDAISLPGLTGEFISRPDVEAKFDLTLYITEQNHGIQLILVYNSNLFLKERMAEMIRQLEWLLTQVVADPDLNIADYSLLTNQAKNLLPDPTHKLASSWREGVHATFASRAHHHPENIALVDKHDCWTYQQLDALSNQLAHYLRTNGIQPQDVVTIYSDRSASLILALLGILKAGAAFVILDPAYPSQRLIDYLHLAQPKAWIQLETAGTLPASLQKYLGSSTFACHLVLPATVAQASILLHDYAVEAPSADVKPDDLAYIAFTSGSTGLPKGILGTHRPLSHFIQWHTEIFGLNQTDRFSMLSGLAHDPLLRDIFTPLCLGATLSIPDQEKMLAPGQLLTWMNQQRITVTHLTPALQQVLTAKGSDDAQSQLLPDLRYAFFGGEPLTRRHVLSLSQFAPNATCVNFYGATETPQAMSYSVADSARSKEIIPLGHGIQDVQLLVLNSVGQLAGVGEVGEIFIRTPYLSQGYLQDESLTRERFLTNPFTEDPTDRIYKTGDVGCYLPNGEVEFLRRNDDQVKIRGFRIELGEIESAINSHPAVRQSVLSVWQVKPEDKRLIAYFVPNPLEFPKPAELRSFLQKKLPDYMVPAGFILLNEIPLTPNGKINRQALPSPDASGFETEKLFAAPVNELEELVANIWADVLGVEKVSVLDSFFELGGHSLLMTQIVSRIFRIVRVELPLRVIFENPTVRGVAQKIESARLANLPIEETAIQPMSRSDNLRLSSSQERMWFLHQLTPESAAYNVFAAARFRGPLNRSVLAGSLKTIVQRHESLRTIFATADGQPIQVIASEPTIVLSIIDLQNLSKDACEAKVVELLKADAIKPFDLAQGPLLRTSLLQLSADEHILGVTMHHIISDQWSMGVFTRELINLYAALDSNQEATLHDLPIQYADFAHWQRESLQGKTLQTQLDYWKKQLQGLQVLELPTDKSRPSIQTYAGARQVFPLSPQLINGMRLLSRSEQVTQFILVLTVFNILLSRYTGQEDIAVGMPTANRDRVEIEPLIGTFVNTLVLRTDLSGNPTFKELLQRVRYVVLDALANKDLPFAKLVEELRPDRDMSYSPLTQVLFNGLNTPFEYPSLRDLTITPVVIDKGSVQFDLSVTISTDITPHISLSYNTDLFDEATGRRMLIHLKALLENVLANPDQHLSDLTILTEEESRKLLVEWNNTAANYPTDQCLHQLFEAQVERSPKTVAVRYGDNQLTYENLNCQANQLAHYLQSLGVGPETPVGICVERSLEMVVGLLGILKAGGTYLPLDPAFPIDRLEYMMADAKAPILLTKSNLDLAQQIVERLPEPAPRIIFIDKDWPIIESHASGMQQISLRTQVSPDNLAYVIYTSGSTGKPKGVQLLHKAVVNFLNSMRQEPGLTSSDILFSITTLSFDIAALEIFLPLITGATVILTDREVAFDAIRLAQQIKDSGATIMQATPATWYMLKESGWKGDRSLKVLCGGEALSQDLANWLVERVGELWNMYGPTETTVWSTVGQITPDTKRITVGRPIANTQIYILDSYLHPVPIGVPGELFIGGDGVARGYLNQPQLTADKFIPNPFIDGSKARIYRTGDKARYLADGQIEILGRADSQVKVRGFRIELGEIESNLDQHPDVQQAVVIVREDSPGNKLLVAYLVPKNEHSLQSKDLRQYLRTSLPEYMIPSFFVKLDKFPMTPNQKVNRKALPRPSMENSSAQDVKVAARNGTEEKLMTIWRDLLHTQSLGVNDNFFDLGGHSLLAVHMFTRIKDEFGMNLPLATLFHEATIEHLANIINSEIKPTTWSSLIEIEPQGNHAPFFCIHGITGDILWFRELARCLAPDYPFYGLQARGLDGVQDPIPRIEEMATLYIDEIRRLQPKGPYYLGGASFGGTVALEVAQQLLRQGDEVALLAIFDHSPPNIRFDIPQGKLKKRLIFIFKVLRNLPNWFREFLQLGPSQMLMRVRRKFRLARKSKGQSENDSTEVFDAADLIDFAPELSDYRQRLITTHFEATRMYQPESYPGRVTLFRAISRPLLDTDDPETGWQKLAPGRVVVSDVPSSHEGMFRKPHVQHLAQRLKASIDQAANQGDSFEQQ